MFQSISLEDFEARTGLRPTAKKSHAEAIVSLRDLAKGEIKTIEAMPRRHLETLLRHVSLEGDPESRPYANCEIMLARMDPQDLQIGQTFIQRSKYQSLLEDFRSLLDKDFCVSRGAAKCNALIIFGEDEHGRQVLAHYMPPIIEATNGHQFLLDGIHRNFLVMSVGTTIESILVKNVNTPLPCKVQSWDSVSIVEEKPPREQRFFGLEPARFRNLKHIGIDG